jgi:hypothetical protein
VLGLIRVRASCRFFLRLIFEPTMLLKSRTIFSRNDAKNPLSLACPHRTPGSDLHRSAEYLLAAFSEQRIDKNFRRSGCGGFLILSGCRNRRRCQED